jgi:GNAT superfamily N-acetyltransferase
MQIRKATLEDMSELIELRIECLRDMDGLSEEQEERVRGKLEPYFAEHLDRDLIVVVAETLKNKLISTAFLVLSEWPSNPSFITGKVGILLNVYTYPEHRGKGVATQVVSYLIEEARRIEVSMIELNATPDGKPLYDKLGFKIPHYTGMRLRLT